MPLKILKLWYKTNIGTNIETIIQDMPPEILKQQQRAILEVITFLQK